MSDPDAHKPQHSDEYLLDAALRGQPRAWAVMVTQLTPYVRTVIRRRAGDLPGDVQEEITQEIWAAIARRGPRQGNGLREPARRYIRRFLRPAIDRVRSAYRVPGTRSRWRNESPDWEAPVSVELESLAEHEDDVAAMQLRRIEARIDVRKLLANAAPLIVLAATMMINRGYNVSQAAGAVGLKRLALHRGLRALARRVA